jgi:uncharacterized protein (DUF1330 family)
MTAYAIGRLTDVKMGPEIRAYLEAIDQTLALFDGRFVIHGGPRIELEGSWSGDLIVIAFPDLSKARQWYGSAEYRRILPLRTRNSSCDVILIEGVEPDHRATDILAAEAQPLHPRSQATAAMQPADISVDEESTG